ncbi:MAG: hypothetical protein ACPL28_03665 [bacterium]
MVAKIYIETFVFGFLYDESEANRYKRKITAKFFEQIRKGYFMVYISPITIAELNRTKEITLREKFKELLNEIDFEFLDIDEWKKNDFNNIVTNLIIRKIIPEDKKDDAAHIAIVTLTPDIDFFVTWNCTHLANKNVFRCVKATLLSLGFEPKFDMATPEEVIKYE